MIKQCSKCKQNLPLIRFYNSKQGKDGKDSWCKNCRLKVYHDNSAVILERRKHRVYANHDYSELLEKQNNKCVCGLDLRTVDNRDICLDHCHVTNKIRGILCRSCNMVLGKVKDNAITLRKLARYIEYYQQQPEVES